MAAKEKNFITQPDVLMAYKKMIEAVPDVEWKGATHPYTSLNGHMYSSVSKDNIIGIRLSKADHQDYLDKHKTGLFEPFPGFFQKGYVPVPDEMHTDTKTLHYWFARSHKFVSSLKPKATTRKKK